MSNPSELKPDYAKRAAGHFNMASFLTLTTGVGGAGFMIAATQGAPLATVCGTAVGAVVCATFAASRVFDGLQCLKAATPEDVRANLDGTTKKNVAAPKPVGG